MANRIVPTSTRVAAKRGFLRTGTQALAAAIPTTGIAVVATGEWALGVGLGLLGAVLTAGLAGTASFLSILSSGIPEEYQPGASPWTDDVGPEIDREPDPLRRARRLAP